MDGGSGALPRRRGHIHAPRPATSIDRPYPTHCTARQAPWSGLIGVPAGFADNVDNDTLGGLSCANGQIAKWNGSAWVCAADQTGGSGGGWSLTGNAGTTPGTNFVGTTDNQALEFKVNGLRALRLVPKDVSPNIIAGYQGNAVASTAVGAAIGGGGVSGGVNQVTDSYGTVSGGQDNQAGNGDADTSNKVYASVGGGLSNKALGEYVVIGGGRENRIDPKVNRSAIGGGYRNVITTTSTVELITIGGGWENAASGRYQRRFRGRQCRTMPPVKFAVIGGGVDNLASSLISDGGWGRPYTTGNWHRGDCGWRAGAIPSFCAVAVVRLAAGRLIRHNGELRRRLPVVVVNAT